jgi:hypothetical protein
MKHIALWLSLIIVAVCGIIAGSGLLQLRAGSFRALAVMPLAVNAVLESEGLHVDSQCVTDTAGAMSGVGPSGERVLVVWGLAKFHGYTLSADVQAEGHDDLWRFNRGGAVLAAISREVSRRCGHSGPSALASTTEAPFEYESR